MARHQGAQPPVSALVVIVALMLTAAGVLGQPAPPQNPPAQPPPAQPPPVPPAEPSAQQPIRSGAELVRVDAMVVDNQGLPVSDLSADDFEVEEDGVMQKIQSFKFVSADGHPEEGDETSLPIRSPDHAAAEAARDDVRVFLIFWDEYHINRMGSAYHAREDLTGFVRTAFGPTDLVAFMDPLTPVDAIRFTRDRHELAEVVRTLRGRSGEYVPVRSVIEEAHLHSREGPERVRSQVTLSALKSAVVYLASLRPARKSLILISEGLRGLGRDEPLMLTDLINTANDSNTGIYTINPLGLTLRRVRGFDGLRALADNTGGESFVTNDFGRALRRVVTQASAYYLLGYAPGQRALDGKFHKIRVRVKRSGVDVRARTGYWAPTLADMRRASLQRANALPPAIASALSQLTPSTARRTVDLWIGTGLSGDGRPEVRMAWSPREEDAVFELPEIAGATAVATSDGAEAFTGDVHRKGLRFGAPPGPLQITFTAHDGAGDVVDRYVRTVQVPDPSARGMWISSPVVIRTRTPLELRTARLDPRPAPAAAREFSRSDRLLIQFAIHGANAAPADVTARLLNDRAAPLTPLPLTRSGTRYEIDLALTSIARGDFVIAIEARHANERAETFVPLRVVR